MKGGYNNGTNSSASAAAASVLGLTTALSQARLNGSHTGGNHSASNFGNNFGKNQTFNAGAIDFENGYNASVNSSGVTSKGQSMPRVRKSSSRNRGNGTGDDIALSGRKRESAVKSRLGKNGKYVYYDGADGEGGLGGAGVPRGNGGSRNNKTKALGGKEKYRYDDVNCSPSINDFPNTHDTHCVVDESIFSPSSVGMFVRSHIGFRDSHGNSVSAKSVYDGESCFDAGSTVIKCAKKMCDPNSQQVIPVYLVPNNASWQPDPKGVEHIENTINEQMAKAIGLHFEFLKAGQKVPDDGIKIDIGFYGTVNDVSGNSVAGYARLRFLSNSDMYIAVDGIDEKYTQEYCRKNADQNRGTWVFPASDIDHYELISILYHELFHAVLQSSHIDSDAFRKAVHVGNTTVDGLEQDCWKLEPADIVDNGEVYGARGSVVHPRMQYAKIKRRGIDKDDVLQAGATLGFNKAHFTAEKQLGQGVFTSVFNLPSNAPIVAEKCKPKDGYGTTVSPSMAFVVIDASDCFSGVNGSDCYNCTSVLGEKPFDEKMRRRQDAALRTVEDRDGNLGLPKGVQMFVATPQAALFGHCNFVVKGVNAGKGEEPLTVHASVHVNAPEEGVKKEYGNYESVLSYVVDSYDPAHASNCSVTTYPENGENDSHVQARIQTVTQMLKTAAMEAYKSVGGDLCERFAVGSGIKNPANLEVAINFVERSDAKLQECLSKEDREGFSMSNVILELSKMIKDKEAEIASATTPVREPVKFTTTSSTKEENETAKAIYDEIEKSINVTAGLSFAGKASVIAASTVAAGIAGACAIEITRRVVKKMKEESISADDIEQSAGDLLENGNGERSADSAGARGHEMIELMPIKPCTIAVQEELDDDLASLHSAASRRSAFGDGAYAESGFIDDANRPSKIYKTKQGKQLRRDAESERKAARDAKSSFQRRY